MIPLNSSIQHWEKYVPNKADRSFETFTAFILVKFRRGSSLFVLVTGKIKVNSNSEQLKLSKVGEEFDNC